MKQDRLVPKRRFQEFKGEWKLKKLDDLGRFGKTYAYSRAIEGSGEYHHIHYGDIHVNYNGIINKYTQLPSLKIEGNFETLTDKDIVIADASEDYEDLGKAVIIEETNQRKIISGLHTFKFSPNKDLSSLFYLYYSQSNLFKEFSYKTGTGISVLGISRENMKNMHLNIPSKKEQKKIGRFFKLLDERIALQERKVEKTKALKAAYLAEMFPAEGKHVPKRRFAGFTDEWERKKIKELGVVNTGSTPSTTNNENYSLNGLIWVTPTDINQRVTTDTNKKLSTKGESKAVIVPPKTILVTSIASIGKNTMVSDFASFNQQINSLSPYKENHSYFLLTQSYYWSEKMKQIAGSGTMQIVNKTMFSEIDIRIPSLEEQQKIGEFFKQLDDLITTHQQKLDKLKATKQAYLNEMFV